MSERARHTGDGVARRKAHQERQRDEREQREEADRAAGTALPPEEGGVELVSADDVLKGVAETGPNYTLLPKRERKTKRRRRRRAAAEASGESASEDGMDGLHEAAAATAGTTGRPCRATRGSGSMREASDSEWELIDVGGETEYWDTRVGGDENYLGEGAFRVEAVRGERRGQSGAVEYEIKWEGYASDENTWEEAEDVSADLVAEWHRERAAAAARGDMQVEAGGAGEGGTSSGGVGAAGENTTGAARPGCSRVLRSALADALAEEWGEEEALLGDEVPLLSPHGPDLSKQLRHLRWLLREFLAEEAKEGTGVPMQCTPTGQHPTMRWTPGPGGAGVLTEGDFEALCRMEVSFTRKEGRVLCLLRLWHGDHAGFGSDGTHRDGGDDPAAGAVRGSFLACYSKLSESEARRLRAKVADPSGFAGLASAPKARGCARRPSRRG